MKKKKNKVPKSRTPQSERPPIPYGRVIRPKKGGKYFRPKEKERMRENYE